MGGESLVCCSTLAGTALPTFPTAPGPPSQPTHDNHHARQNSRARRPHLRPAKTGDDAKLELRQPQPRPRRRDARVAAHRHLQAAAERDALDGRHGRLGAGLEDAADLVVDLVVDAAAAGRGDELRASGVGVGGGGVGSAGARGECAAGPAPPVAAADCANTSADQRTRQPNQTKERTWLMSKPAEKLLPEPVTTIALTAGLLCAAARLAKSARSTGGGGDGGCWEGTGGCVTGAVMAARVLRPKGSADGAEETTHRDR